MFHMKCTSKWLTFLRLSMEVIFHITMCYHLGIKEKVGNGNRLTNLSSIINDSNFWLIYKETYSPLNLWEKDTHVLDFWLKPPVTAGWLKNRRSKSVFRFTPLFLLIFLPFPYEISWKCSSLSKELVYNVLEHVLQKSLKLIVIGSNTTNDYFL